jgi:hypothetical protein
MKIKIVKFLLMMALTTVGAVFFTVSVSAATPDFRADDMQQKIVLTTTMPTYDGSAGYAIHALGYLINITSGSTSKTVFLEGDIEYHKFHYSTIIAEFNTEHGSAGKTLAENYFYNYNGTMTLDTVFTLWQKGGGYSGNYDDYKCVKAGKIGWVQAKINGSSNVTTPTEEVYASNWTSQIKTFPVKFWNWSSKSYAWSSYASKMNGAKNSVYTLNPSTFTATTVKNYSAPYNASDWQNAAMMCEFSSTAVPAIREYYKRTIIRDNPTNFKVSEIQSDSVINDSGTVRVLYSNDHSGKGIQMVRTNLTLSGGSSIDYDLSLDTNNYSGCWVTYNVSGGSEGNKTLAASINGGINGTHTISESTYADNVKTKSVTVKLPRDFGTWGLTAYNASGEQVTSSSAAKLMENTNCTFQVNWTNYKNIAQSNVKCELYLDDVLFYTDYVSFSGGYQTVTRTYTKNIGWGTNNRVLKTRINYDNRNAESDPSDNESTASFGVTEYRDFSVSGLAVSSGSVYENGTVTVTCRSDNWNYLKAYSNIPVELVYGGQVVATQYVNFSPYGIGYHTFTLNVGSGIGTKSLYARINWNNRASEVNTANNQTDAAYITVNRMIDTGITIISPNSDYRAGTEVITSFRVSNNSRHNLIPDDHAAVRFRAYYYNSGGSLVYLADTSKSTVIPAYDNNLVYFKWMIPNDMAGKYIYLSASVLTAEYDGNTGNNNTSRSQYIYPVTNSQTPDTQYEASKPAGWTNVSAPAAYANAATWSEWSYTGGTFIKTTYGIKISYEDVPVITPDSNSPSAEYVNGQWHMKSGYGYSLSLYPVRSFIGGTSYPASAAYTSVQRCNALFPEFSYSSVSGKYRTLQPISGTFQFNTNANAYNKRLHYIPVWFPDGNYTVSCYLFDCWTPAGMLSAVLNSNPININGNLYDDGYIGR